MLRFKIIEGFIRRYKALFILTVLSVIIALVYVFTADLPEWFPFAGALFTLLDTLGLAIIANCIFCYFQIYLPECREHERVKPTVSFSVSKILTLIGDPYERIYRQKTGRELGFDEISEDELKKLLDGIDPKGDLGYKFIDANSKLISVPTYWIVNKYVEDARDEIELLISLFGKYLDAELISLLMEIHRCPYFALITKFQHSGVLDKLANIGPSEELVPVQQLYKRLKKYVGE